MKTTKLIILLFMLYGQMAFATSDRAVEIDRSDFPSSQLPILQTLQHDTLLFKDTDTIYRYSYCDTWQWFMVSIASYTYTRERYYDIRVTADKIWVKSALYHGEEKCIKQAINERSERSMGYLYFGGLCVIYASVLCIFLQFILIFIHSNDRYVTRQQQKKEKIAAILLFALVCVGTGCLVKVYSLCIFSGAVCVVYFFMPESVWWSRLRKMESEAW
jgi:hypothetical protein